MNDLGLDKDITLMADSDDIVVKVIASRIEAAVEEKPAAAAETTEGAEAKEAVPAAGVKGEKPKAEKAAS